jgi:hypothetical protein
MIRPKTDAQIQVCQLEDRTVPAMLDLTAAGTISSFTGDAAVFQQSSPQPTGTGHISSFVRLQTPGAGTSQQQGYNTDARPLQYDQNNSPQFTRGLLLSDVPEVNLGGREYRQFLLDINQKSSQPYLSLDELRFYVGNSGSLNNYDPATKTLSGLAPVYDMAASAAPGDPNWVKLDARNSHGSGSGDMFLYIPSELFGGGPSSYVYLYSKFGQNFMANAGFEEWAVSNGASGIVPGAISGTVTVGGAPQGNVVVFLDTNHNGVLDSDETYTVTDTNGNYSFNGLATGLGTFSAYQVTVIPGDLGTTSQPSIDVYLAAAQSVTGVDFNIVPPSGSGGQLPPPPPQ